jgi:hypothetical protein
MAHIRPCAIVVGVNVGPRAKPLRNAENDARDIHNLLTGPLGPVAPADAKLLVGRGATRASLLSAFATAQRAGATHLFLCFSGHGALGSILLADGPFGHEALARCLGAIRGAKKAVILDCCFAGSFIPYSAGVSGIGAIPDDSWSRAFAYAIPGTRVLVASRDDETSSDGSGTNGAFTHRLYEGLQHLDGDIHDIERSYISASAAFQYASRGVRVDTSDQQNPEADGPLSDFPLAMSQDRVVIGEARAFDDGRHALVETIGRLGVETCATVEFMTVEGTVVGEENYRLRPERYQDVTRVPLQVNDTILERDPRIVALRRSGHDVHFGVRLLVRDTRDRVLASQNWTLRVPPPRPRIVERTPALVAPSRPSTGSGLGWGILAATALVGAGVAIARAPKWDPEVERYRSRDGKFRARR